MGTIELRKSIHSFIDHADERLLRMIQSMALEYSKDETDDLSQELKFALDKGIESLDKGRKSSHKDVMVRMRQKYPSLIK